MLCLWKIVKTLAQASSQSFSKCEGWKIPGVETRKLYEVYAYFLSLGSLSFVADEPDPTYIFTFSQLFQKIIGDVLTNILFCLTSTFFLGYFVIIIIIIVIIIIVIIIQFGFTYTLSGLRQFLATESPSNIMKFFYFTLKAHFVLEIFQFLVRIFVNVGKRLY